jgi:hypothetical protein
VNIEKWLTSCDDDGLAAGQNLAVLGSELIQFGWAQALGGGRYRLSRILRGRGGTEWACSEHTAGEPFCLLKPGTIQSLPLPGWAVGAVVSATARGSTAASIGFQGESIRPPSPVNLAAELQSNGELILTWTRRSRLGFAWVDEIDAPLGEAREQYRVNLTGPAGSAEYLVGEASLTVAATEVATLGAGPLSIEARQIGDVATSRPAQLTIPLAQE